MKAFWNFLKRTFTAWDGVSVYEDVVGKSLTHPLLYPVHGNNWMVKLGSRITKIKNWRGEWEIVSTHPSIWMCYKEENGVYVHKFSIPWNKDICPSILEYIRGEEFAEALFPTNIISPTEAGITLLKK